MGARSDDQHGESLPTVRLNKPVERAVAHGHPWIYRDALLPHRIGVGEAVRVLDRRGRFLAAGLCESGAIAVRVFTRSSSRPIDAQLFRERISAALQLRDRLIRSDTDAWRWVHGEGDALPGLVVDRYGGAVVVKFDGQAILAWRRPVLAALRELAVARGVECILLRSNKAAQRAVEVIQGELPATPLIVREQGMSLLVDVVVGQKTGMFLDHRPGRARVRELAAGLRVLNLFGYTGGFSVAAGLGGAARVVTVDSARPAIELAARAWQLNGLQSANHEVCVAEVADFMTGVNAGSFELVIADPPSFAPREAAREAATRAYRALHRSCLRAVALGGYYLAASCSSHVDRECFETGLREAAHAEKRSLQVVDRWGAGADHPVALGFPEGEYLKVTLARVFER